MNSLILRTGTRFLVWLLLAFSIYTLLRGHNSPGGGFIGGLIGATGLVLYSFAHSPRQAQAALRFDPQNIAVIGVILALASGLYAGLFGQSPFTGYWSTVAGIKLSTILVFDIGVYLAVFGGILTLVFALEEPR